MICPVLFAIRGTTLISALSYLIINIYQNILLLTIFFETVLQRKQTLLSIRFKMQLLMIVTMMMICVLDNSDTTLDDTTNFQEGEE